MNQASRHNVVEDRPCVHVAVAVGGRSGRGGGDNGSVRVAPDPVVRR